MPGIALILNFRNLDKVTKITNTLNVKVPPRDLKSKDTRHLLSLIFSQWLSLSTCIIQAAIDVVPSPSNAQATRIPKMLYPDLSTPTIEPKNKLERDLFSANSNSDAYVCAFVSKMFAVSQKDLPENKKRALTAEEMREKAREARAAKEEAQTSEEAPLGVEYTPTERDEDKPRPEAEAEIILGFARLYSGTIRVGSKIYAALPKYNSALEPTQQSNAKYLVTATVEGLYLMMGKELVAVSSVRAGNIFAVKGLEGKVWRSATLCAPSEEGVDPSTLAGGEFLTNLGRINRTVSGIFFVCVY